MRSVTPHNILVPSHAALVTISGLGPGDASLSVLRDIYIQGQRGEIISDRSGLTGVTSYLQRPVARRCPVTRSPPDLNTKRTNSLLISTDKIENKQDYFSKIILKLSDFEFFLFLQ